MTHTNKGLHAARLHAGGPSLSRWFYFDVPAALSNATGDVYSKPYTMPLGQARGPTAHRTRRREPRASVSAPRAHRFLRGAFPRASARFFRHLSHLQARRVMTLVR